MARVHTDKNIWLATVRPDGRPHLTPIWFVFHDAKFWVCTGAEISVSKWLMGNAEA